MTAKNKLIQKSFFLSLLLLLVIIASQLVEIPYGHIILIVDASLLTLLSIVQLLEFKKMINLLVSTSDILSQGNERDFSVLKEKEKSIINYKITMLIEQLEDSVNQTNSIFEEKENLEREIDNYRETIDNIQTSLNRDVIAIKSRILKITTIIDSIILDFSTLQNSQKNEEELTQSLLTAYSTYVESYSTINQSIEKSRIISDREITRSEELLTSLARLYDQSEESEEQLTIIFKGIDNIRDVTDFINAVAEKASILSLNAAIESAHAGEAGKGFAVVAEEVGALANTTAENAENINKALYSVSDLISENKKNKNSDLNFYPELISDAKEINRALLKIRELLNFMDFLKKPVSPVMSEKQAVNKKIIGNSIQILSAMKEDIEKSIKTIDQLGQPGTLSSEEVNQNYRIPINETSLKPVHDEIPLDL